MLKSDGGERFFAPPGAKFFAMMEPADHHWEMCNAQHHGEGGGPTPSQAIQRNYFGDGETKDFLGEPGCSKKRKKM